VHPIFKGYFQGKCDGQEFENKMKMIMNKLRFYISGKNLDLKKVMDSMGFSNAKQEISYQEFYHFFLNVYPEITNEETDCVFKKTDSDHSGAISVEELKGLLLSNGIKLEAQFDVIPSFEKRSDGKETFQRISPEASRKITACFEKLYRIITRNGLTLWKVFNDFDKKKGSLTLSEFTLLLRKISSGTNDITEDEIRSGFELIDEDASNSIEFEELDKYYSKVNGIPQTAPPKKEKYEPMQIESEGSTN
jgi:Ca2+-binding EF-hand superfamily protein